MKNFEASMNGTQLADFRKIIGLKQEELGNVLGCTGKTIHNWETNKVCISELASRVIRLAMIDKDFFLRLEFAATLEFDYCMAEMIRVPGQGNLPFEEELTQDIRQQ